MTTNFKKHHKKNHDSRESDNLRMNDIQAICYVGPDLLFLEFQIPIKRLDLRWSHNTSAVV